MLVVIDKHSGVPIFKQIMDQITHQILTGRLKEGDPIPSVKDLSGDLKVNPMTVSKAYQLLEHEGYLERRRGIGMFAAKPQQELTQQAKIAAISDSLTRAVVQAIQMGVPEAEVLELARRRYRELNPEKPAGQDPGSDPAGV